LLELHINDVAQLAPADFISLGSLSQLRTLELYSNSVAADVTGEDWAQLLGQLGGLKTLVVRIDMPSAPQRLKIVGSSCRALKELELEGEVYFDDAFDQSVCLPLFPQLRHLKVTSLGMLPSGTERR
jgi:hypothetical protein